MTRKTLVLALVAVLATGPAFAAKFTYHGDLMDGTAPARGAYDLRLRALASPTAKVALGEATELPGVKVSDGRFAVELDLPENPLGETYVEVAVRKAGTNDKYETLGAAQAVTKANTGCWALDGNTGVPGGSFLGYADPSDLSSLDLRASNARVARFSGDNSIGADGGTATIALGSSANVAVVRGATVAGGGATRDSVGNPCPSCANSAIGVFSTVGGGVSNYASGRNATIGGGDGNRTANNNASVSGGARNLAGGFFGAIAGGESNLAAGSWSASPGGLFNCAGGNFSFAGGRRAKIRHGNEPSDAVCDGGVPSSGDSSGDEGTFVWADALDDDFVSSGPNQFLVRASGGVGINRTPVDAQTEMTIGASSAADATTSLRLQASNNSAGDLYVDTATNAFTVIARSNDLRLHTFQLGAYIHTNDKFGVKQRPVLNDLEVNGTASKSAAGDWLANSDRRIKTEIEPIPNALDTILQLRPVTFRYDAAYREKHKGLDEARYYNVIAQEFAEVFPGAVKGSGEYLPGKTKSPENEILQVDTYPAQITAIAAIQELAVNDDALREQLGAVKRENAQLRMALQEVLDRLSHLESKQER